MWPCSASQDVGRDIPATLHPPPPSSTSTPSTFHGSSSAPVGVHKCTVPPLPSSPPPLHEMPVADGPLPRMPRQAASSPPPPRPPSILACALGTSIRTSLHSIRSNRSLPAFLPVRVPHDGGFQNLRATALHKEKAWVVVQRKVEVMDHAELTKAYYHRDKGKIVPPPSSRDAQRWYAFLWYGALIITSHRTPTPNPTRMMPRESLHPPRLAHDQPSWPPFSRALSSVPSRALLPALHASKPCAAPSKGFTEGFLTTVSAHTPRTGAAYQLWVQQEQQWTKLRAHVVLCQIHSRWVVSCCGRHGDPRLPTLVRQDDGVHARQLVMPFAAVNRNQVGPFSS
jgi:hypothetical protein